MPEHRFGLHFVDEKPEDRARWTEWIGALSEPLRAAIQLGERRPLITLAAPFPIEGAFATRRDDEVASLERIRGFVTELGKLAAAHGPISLLRSGRKVGRVEPGGPDGDLTAMLAEWQTLLDERPADDPLWERPGWVSVWAGVLPRAEYDKLFVEYPHSDGPLSGFARALRIDTYDHANIERSHVGETKDLGTVLQRLSRSPSFVDQVSEADRARPVCAAVTFYETDFAQRPRNAARNKLVFVASYPYKRG